MEVDANELDFNERFIADCAAEAQRKKNEAGNEDISRKLAREKADDMTCEVEAHRARAYTTPGNPNTFNLPQQTNYYSNAIGGGVVNNLQPPTEVPQLAFTASVDDNYIAIGGNIDAQLQEKIKVGGYIDFARLLPRDRKSTEDHRMELINKGGQTFFVPVSDRESAGGITNFNKWEQAFRVYSNLYLKYNPAQATELIQYNHVVYTAASTYVWDNVYTYDKEFRIHMGNVPQRNWGLILQQAWSMYLKDKLRFNEQLSKNNSYNKHKKEVCKRFNKGLCTAGLRCQYEHKCLECGKFGHRAHICRKRLSKNNTSSPGDGQGGNSKTQHRVLSDVNVLQELSLINVYALLDNLYRFR